MTLQPLVELALAAYMTYGLVYLIDREVYYSIPFLILFQVGFGYVALMLDRGAARLLGALRPGAAAGRRRGFSAVTAASRER